MKEDLQSPVDLVVGTPGTLLQFRERGTVSFDEFFLYIAVNVERQKTSLNSYFTCVCHGVVDNICCFIFRSLVLLGFVLLGDR